MSLISSLRAQLRSGGIEKLFFVGALCFFAFGYGVASTHWELFPYPVLSQAAAGWRAWRQIGGDRMPPQITHWESAGTTNSPVRTLSAEAGREALLVVGGFYSRMDLCPTAGCLAWIMDRDGKTLHTWAAPDPEEFSRGLTGFSGAVKALNIYVIGVALQADGSLITTFHGHSMFPYQVGIAKFDKHGRPLWKHFDNSHHWPTVDDSGNVYVPYVRAVKDPQPYFAHTMVPTACSAGTAYMEGVRIYGPDGDVKREFSMYDVIAQADYPGLPYAVKDGCDAQHVNSIDLVNAAAAVTLRVNVGDLLVSLREPSALVILDKETGALKRLISSRTAAQHSAKFLPDGSILVFDNLGGNRSSGGSRVLWIDPVTNTTRTVFPQGDEGALLPFYSVDSGVLTVSPDGSRVMVSPSKQGRTIEVDLKTGEPLWILDHVMDFAPFLKSRGITQDSTWARTTANGVYYVTNLEFIDAK